MGNEASGYPDSVRYSDLHRRHEQLTSESGFGARITEHNTGQAIAREISSCCAGIDDADTYPTLNCHPTHNAQCQIRTDGDSQAVDNSKYAVTGSDMKDSGFIELVGQHKQSSTDCEETKLSENGFMKACEDDSSLATNDLTAVNTLRSSLPDFTDAHVNAHSSPLDGRVRQVTTEGATGTMCAADSRVSDSVGTKESHEAPDAPGYNTSQSVTDHGAPVVTLHEPRELEDMVPSSTPVPSVELRRKKYREGKHSASCPSPVLSTKDISRSSSTISDYSFDSELVTEVSVRYWYPFIFRPTHIFNYWCCIIE